VATPQAAAVVASIEALVAALAHALGPSAAAELAAALVMMTLQPAAVTTQASMSYTEAFGSAWAAAGLGAMCEDATAIAAAEAAAVEVDARQLLASTVASKRNVSQYGLNYLKLDFHLIHFCRFPRLTLV
jgi:hypothetical protein